MKPQPQPAVRRVLVTGATGYIGSALVREALRRGFAVRALVRDPSRADLGAVEVVQGDLTRPETLRGVEEGVDLVLHSAGILGKWGRPDRMLYAVNVQGSMHLLARFRGTSARFVHLSAAGVSGPLSTGSVDERYSCCPATAYERSKLAGEWSVLTHAARSGIDALVVRPCFTYGPGDPHKVGLYRAVSRGRFAFIGDGSSVLHPVYCSDLVDGVFKAVERGHRGEVYILGGDRPVSKRELVETIADALDVPRPRWHMPGAVAMACATVLEAVGRALGFEPMLTRSRVSMMRDNFGYSIAKAREQLGHEPQVSLAEGVARTVADYRASGALEPGR